MAHGKLLYNGNRDGVQNLCLRMSMKGIDYLGFSTSLWVWFSTSLFTYLSLCQKKKDSFKLTTT